MERQLAQFSDYSGMVAALRDRANSLQVSGETIDHVGGMASRYTSKLLGPSQVRRLGIVSLGAILGALGVKLALLEDKQSMRKYGKRLDKRDERLVRHRQSKE